MNQLPGLEPVTTTEIVAELLRTYDGDTSYGTPNSVAIEEARVGTGMSRRSVDVLVIRQFKSEGHSRTAFEVKVSRGDFRKEIREPAKRRSALRYSNYFYFVTPPGLITPEEVPPECGLLEYHRVPEPTAEQRREFSYRRPPTLRTIVAAPFRDCGPPTWDLFISVLRKERERCFEQATRRHNQLDNKLVDVARKVLGRLDYIRWKGPQDGLDDEVMDYLAEYRRLCGGMNEHLIQGRAEPFDE